MCALYVAFYTYLNMMNVQVHVCSNNNNRVYYILIRPYNEDPL